MINPCLDHCYLRFGKQYTPDCGENCTYAKAVKDLKKVTGEWISVKTALPKNVANRVLVMTDSSCNVMLGHYEGNDFRTGGWYNLETDEPFNCRVTYWRELPVPPEVE